MISKLKTWLLGLTAIVIVGLRAWVKLLSNKNQALQTKNDDLSAKVKELSAMQQALENDITKTRQAINENSIRRAEVQEALDKGRRNYFEEQ